MRILAKQFYALLYDAMILIAFSMVVTAAFEGIANLFIYEAHELDEAFLKSGLGNLTIVLQLTLSACYFLYYHFSYMRGGQTIGMKSWKIKLESTTGQLKLSQTLLRFVLAWPSFFLCGIGYLSALKNEHCLTIPDKYSGTTIIYKV